MDENRKKLYDQLSANYDMGTFDEFDSDLDNEDNQKVAWEAMGGQDGYGDFGLFQQAIQRSPQAAETQQAEPAATQPVTTQPDATQPDVAPLMETQQPAWTTTASAMPSEEDADADISLPDAPNPGTPKDTSTVIDDTTENKPDVVSDQAEDYSTKSVEELKSNIGVPADRDVTQHDIDSRVTYIESIVDPVQKQAEYDKLMQSLNGLNRYAQAERDAERVVQSIPAEAKVAQHAESVDPAWAKRDESYGRLVRDGVDYEGKKAPSAAQRGIAKNPKRYNDNIMRVRQMSDDELRRGYATVMDSTAYGADDELRAVDAVPYIVEMNARANGGHAQTMGEEVAKEYLAQHPELKEAYNHWKSGDEGYRSDIDKDPAAAIEVAPFAIADRVLSKIDRRINEINKSYTDEITPDPRKPIPGGVLRDPSGAQLSAMQRRIYDLAEVGNLTRMIQDAFKSYDPVLLNSYIAAFAEKENTDIPSARKGVADIVLQKVRAEILSRMTPENNAAYASYALFGNTFAANILKAGLALMTSKPGETTIFGLEDEALANYGATHQHWWDQVVRGAVAVGTLAIDAETIGFTGPSFFSGLAGRVVANRASNVFLNRLLTSTVSGAVNFGTFEAQTEWVNQLKTGERNFGKVLTAYGGGLSKGAAFGMVGSAVDRLFWNARGWVVPFGEAVKILGETATFSGIGYLEHGKLTAEDWGTNFGMVLSGKVKDPAGYIRDVQARMEGKRYLPKINRISKEYAETLSQKGYSIISSILRTGRVGREQLIGLDGELNRMRSDNTVPWETLRMAEYALDGRLYPSPPITKVKVERGEDSAWTFTPTDNDGRAVGESITVKGTEAKKVLGAKFAHEIEKNNLLIKETASWDASVCREVGKAVLEYCKDNVDGDATSVYKIFMTAHAKHTAGVKLGDVERAIYSGVNARLKDVAPTDDVSAYKAESKREGYDLDRIVRKPADERSEPERIALKNYIQWLDGREVDARDLNEYDFKEWAERAPEVAAANSARIAKEFEAKADEFHAHLEDLSGKMDLGNVVVLEHIDQVADAQVRQQIERSERMGEKGVPGWYDADTDTTYVYLPHNENIEDLDRTIMHEQVTHHGLRVLKTQSYNDLCDRVWNSMSDAERDRWENYPGVKGIDDQTKRQRAAADEYIAHLAERTDPENEGLWKSFVANAKEQMRKFGIRTDRIGDAELERIIRESYRNLRDGRDGDAANGTAEAERGNEAALDTEGEAPREETAEPTTEEVIAPTETAETPPAAESGETPPPVAEPPVVESEPKVERPTSAVGRVEGTPADMNDWAELLAENDAASLPVEEVQAGLELMEREREQAHRYAAGELTEEPSNWEYWAARDGLSEPTRQAEPVATEPPAAETPKEPVVETESQHTEPVATEAPTEDAQRDTKLPKGANAEAETMEPSELPMTEHIAKMTDAWGDVTRVEVVGQNDNGTTRVRLWFKNRDQRGVEADVDLRGPQPPETPTPPTEPTGDATTADTTTDVTTERPAEVTGSADDRQMRDVLGAKLGEVDEDAERRAAQEADPYYMPMENKGGGRMSPNYRKATAEQIFNHLNDRENESGRDTLDGNIADGVKRAEDKVKDVERREPKGKGRSDKSLTKWEKELSEARAQLEKWHEVERMRREQKAAEGDDSDPTWKQAYDEFNSSDEEPVNLEDYVARHLYGTKFKWKDKEFVRLGGRTHGLGGHLGLSKSDKERRAFFGWIDEKNGSYPESVAEGLYANMPDWMRERYDTMEILDAVLNVVGSNPRPRDMVVDYVKRLREQNRDMDEYYADEAAGARGFHDAGEMDAYDNMREREAAGFHDVAAAGREADGARADLIADAQARLNDPNASEYEKQAARAVLRYRQRDSRDGVTAQGTEGDGVRFRVVRNPQEIERLERGKKVKRYRAMQLIDGKLYPPMSARVNGQLREPTELGVWEQADENPELARNGKFRLDKGQKGQGAVDAAYNPYFHTSTSAMNDQFSSAWKRPELVVVEVEIPESELTSGYRAEGAKDAVGDTDWKSGSVNNALPADRQRTVTLSRYMKAVRIVPDAEVADMIAHQLDGTDVSIPFNVVNENLRNELVKRGVKIGEPEKSNAGRASRAAYEQWMDEAESGGMRMRHRAPNGEESRLDERQYDEVRTDKFKRWFGDWENEPEEASKVVDKNGEPLVVWHGGLFGQPYGEEAYAWDADGSGGWFSSDRKYAEGYLPVAGNPTSVYLDIRNPFELKYNEELIVENGKRTPKLHEIAQRLGVSDDTIYNMIDWDFADGNDVPAFAINRTKEFADLLREKGYDGAHSVEFGSDAYMILDPTQIKSAAENNGDFSRENPDIRFRTRELEDVRDELGENGISIDDKGLLDRYGLKNVTLSKHGNYVTLTHFIADEQGQGNGTRFMEDLTKLADQNGWTLALTPDTSFGGTSVKRLKDFYKRFGFKDNTGSRRDFETRESMIRRPNEQLSQNDSEVIFDAAKNKFGVTDDIREAGYILPDGSMLDFSGRNMLDPGTDSSFLKGRRTSDHRDIGQIGWAYDENGNEYETGLTTDMADFISRGAIRIDDNAGSINLSMAPTREQEAVLRRLIANNDGNVWVDFGDGNTSEHYAEYSGAKATRVLGDIDRYYSEGIKPQGNTLFRVREEEDNAAREKVLKDEREQVMREGVTDVSKAAIMDDDTEDITHDIRFNHRTEPSIKEDIARWINTKERKTLGWTAEQVESISEETSDFIRMIHMSLYDIPEYKEWSERMPTVAVDWRDGQPRYTMSWSRQNIEYKYDISADLLCINNEGMEDVLSHPVMADLMMALRSEDNGGKGMTSAEYLDLYNTLRDIGFVVPCRGCFDAAARFKMLPSVAKGFANMVNMIVDERNRNPKAFDAYVRSMPGKERSVSGFPVKGKTKEDSIRIAVAGGQQTEHIPWTKFMSAQGQTKILEELGGIFRAWQKTGSGRPKDKLLPEPWNGVMVNSVYTIIAPYNKKTPSFREQEVNYGTGLRGNSHSKFRPLLFVDEYQLIRECYLKHLKYFKYMKELDDVRAFGDLGIKFNMSFFPAFEEGCVAAGLDKNGNYIASEESVGAREFPYTGADGKTHYDGMRGLEEAMKYVNQDNSLSSVVLSLPHLLKCLADVPTPSKPSGRWGSLIPFHPSGATASALKQQGLGEARAMTFDLDTFIREATTDYDKGVTSFEAVQNDRFDEGWVYMDGKNAGEPVKPNMKIHFVGCSHYYNRERGAHLFNDSYILDSELNDGHYNADGSYNVKRMKSDGHSFEREYNEKVREYEREGDVYAYKTAADYFIKTMRELGLRPRFDFNVPESSFLEMCSKVGIDPHVFGWKGEGHDWTPCDSEAYYSLYCDYGMTDAKTGKLSPQRRVGYQEADGSLSMRMPDNIVEIVRNGIERYTERRHKESSLVDDAITTFAHKMVEQGKLDSADAERILGGLDQGGDVRLRVRDGRHGSAGIEGPRDGHEAAVEEARRRLESDDASEFERTAARAVIRAYGGGSGETPGSGGPRFRIREPQKAIDDYERAVNSSGFQVTEALQDSMMGLKKLMQAIVGKDAKGKEKAIQDIAGFENAYLKENRLQSESVAQVDEYRTRYYTPLVKAVSALIGKGGKKHRTEATAELTDYMMAKHGLERNLILAERDATEEFESDANKDGNGNYIRSYDDILAEKREKDYSGLTALTGEADVAAAEDAARQMVDNYEMGHDTTELWQRTKEATDATLDKLHDSGVLSDEAYNRAKTMFEYYIPLRGWDETTSDEVYGYLTGPDGPLNGNVFKHAEGRRSKADDPLATIMMMASDAIRQGNRNVMKQRFLTFVLNNPSDAVSVSRLWLQRDPVTDKWKPVFADLDPADSPEVVRQKVEQFEQDMAQLAAQDPDNFKHGKQTENIPYKVVNGNIGEHRVLVKHNGQTYVMTINGNPRAAQALNGLTNPDTRANNFVGKTLGAFAKLNRVLSQLFTTYSPKFVVRNFARDMGYSIASSAFVKEGGEYGRKFVANYTKVGLMGKLFSKWESGTLDRSKPLEDMFYQFMHNGGETGFSAPKELNDYKKALDKELRKENSKTRQLLGSFGEFYLRANRAVENRARFSAFLTSMEMGRGIDRSIWDAKEVSVNFNKKGAGAKMFDNPDQTLAGKAAGLIGDGGRSLFVFWNASVQGLTNYGKTFKAHPVKATAHASLLAGLAYMMPQLMQAIFGDDDGYYDLPDYVRRNNICFRWSKDMPWITIPLSPEHAVSYAIGDIIAGITSGKKQYLNGEEIANDFAKEVSKALPLDFTEGGGGHWWLPSAIKPAYEAYEMNESWTGAPIANQTEWNKQAPEYQRVYKTASQPFVKASEWINDMTNSDEDSKGLINFNPSKLEYVFKGYAGGLATLFNDCVRMFDVAFGDAEFEAHDIPVAGAMLKSGNPTTKQKEMMRQYYHYRDDAEGAKWELKNREGDALERFKQTDRYERYLVWTEMSKDVDKLKKQMKDNPDLEAEYYAAVEKLVSAMREQHAGKRKPSQETIAEVKESERKDSIDALTDDEVAAAVVPLSDNAPQDSVDVKREGIKRAYKSEGLSYDTPSDRERNAQAYERRVDFFDIDEDKVLKGRRDALKKSVGEKFEKMGVKYKKDYAGWDWYADDDASASIDEIKAYYQSHKAELDEYGILLWWFGSSKGSSGYIKKGFTDGKHDPDEVMKEYREARKEVLAKTKQR